MQLVNWFHNLGVLSQDSALFQSVKSLLDEKCRRKFLWGKEYNHIPDWTRIAPELLERDLIRSAFLRITSFGAENHTTCRDSVYAPRDRQPESAAGNLAFKFSDHIFHGRESLHDAPSGKLVSKIWTFLSKAPHVSGYDNVPPSEDIRYDSKFLLDSYMDLYKSYNFTAIR